MTEDTTPEWFTAWHRDYFNNHAELENIAHERVSMLEQEFKSFLNVIRVGIAIVLICGGATVGVATWAFIQNVNEVKELQRAVAAIASAQAVLIDRDKILFDYLKGKL